MTINGINKGDLYSLAYKNTENRVTPFGMERGTTLKLRKKTYSFNKLRTIYSEYDTFEGTFNGYLISDAKRPWYEEDILDLYLLRIKEDTTAFIYLGRGIIENISLDFSVKELNKLTFDFKGFIKNQKIMEEL